MRSGDRLAPLISRVEIREIPLIGDPEKWKNADPGRGEEPASLVLN